MLQPSSGYGFFFVFCSVLEKVFPKRQGSKSAELLFLSSQRSCAGPPCVGAYPAAAACLAGCGGQRGSRPPKQDTDGCCVRPWLGGELAGSPPGNGHLCRQPWPRHAALRDVDAPTMSPSPGLSPLEGPPGLGLLLIYPSGDGLELAFAQGGTDPASLPCGQTPAWIFMRYPGLQGLIWGQ